ncbi:galactokinase [Candidatus Haliotispira prima]|uniref:Galactokinase n=1 Tax=Candidatus Haliotispira prima TaxID=3034016 RepID=A0ABY8MJV4_9SPIO|nr:galactokinase [Candidatus Haliotispira prima]
MVKDSGAEPAAVCRQQFERHYAYPAEKTFFSPGRINIIGEHIDYNGGLVFPCAIGLGTAAAVGRRSGREAGHGGQTIRLYSHNFPELTPQEFCVAKETLAYREEQGWCNYVLGMLSVLAAEGVEPDCDLDIVFYGNLPQGGSGLSSSASLEVLTGYILQSYGGSSLSRERLAVLARRAENEFCGIHCGIMDQFVIAVARAGHACLLDCAGLDYRHVPLELGQHTFLVANTKLPRKLRESKYNERRAECEAALAVLQKSPAFGGKRDLCSVSEPELDSALELLGHNETLLRRVRHVVTENGRTQAAARAMEAGDRVGLGALLSASHHSLSVDYQVSGPHLDSLTALLEQEPSVQGARMTGAGFGGCAIALVRLDDDLEQMQQRISVRYRQQFGWEPEFYLSDAADGVRELI